MVVRFALIKIIINIALSLGEKMRGNTFEKRETRF